jgi:branched-chain amino acid transport system ATP-binding protein
MVAEEIFRIVLRLKEELGMTVLLVEQNAAIALEVADHAYVMETGRIMLKGPAAEVRENAAIKEFYLGLNESGVRRSYRESRVAVRRRRWLA